MTRIDTKKKHTTCWKPTATIDRVGQLWTCRRCNRRFMVSLDLQTSPGQQPYWCDLDAKSAGKVLARGRARG